MRFLTDIDKTDLQDTIVLLRSGLNVPTDESGKIIDDFRIKQALPTIEYLRQNAKRVYILAHKGRERTESLHSVFNYINEILPELEFATSLQDASHLQSSVVLVENIRQDPRETSLSQIDRDTFAQEIKDILCHDSDKCLFVEDAFSTCHRNHATITSLPKFLPNCGGLLLQKEIEHLSCALKPERPSLFILGGAKFATKEPLIRKFLSIYDNIFIAGAIANEFFKAHGYEVGNSLIHDGKIPHDILYNDKIILPEDVYITDEKGHTVTAPAKNVPANATIVDVVLPTNLFNLTGVGVKYVLWNGPLGYYEGGYLLGTNELLNLFVGSNAIKVTGGGDTLATIPDDKRSLFNHISSGGGAMLTFLQNGTLIGLEALED